MSLVIALIVLQLIVVGISILGARDQDLSSHRVDSDNSLYAAEGVANMAMHEISTQTDDDGDGTIGSIGGNVVANGPLIGTARAAAGVSVAGSTYTVTVTGQAHTSQHAFSMQVTHTPPISSASGLYTEFFQLGSAPGSVNNVNWNATPKWVGLMPNVDRPYEDNATTTWPGGLATLYALRFRGNVTIPTAGAWTFYVNSDDGAFLYINGTLVVNNDGDHSQQVSSGTITLPAGLASFDLKFYQNGGHHVVAAYWSGPGVGLQTVIPATAFSCTPLTVIPPIVGDSSVLLNGSSNCYIDAFNPNNGAYGGANVITSGYSVQTNCVASAAFQVKKATVKGNALCGPGGAPGTVIVLQSGGSVTGTSSAAVSGVAAMTTNPPSFMPASSGAFSGSGTQTFSSNKHYSTFSLTTSNAVLNISGNVIIQCDGNFAMDQNAQINILASSSLSLYIGGTLTMSTSSAVNSNTGDPRRVTIYMTGSSTDVTLNNSSLLYAYVFNPAGALNVMGGSSPSPKFYGVYHGTGINIQNNGKIHADASFASTTGGSSGSTTVSTWVQSN